MEPLLKVTNLNKSFGGVRAIVNLSYSVEAGKICAIIGPNGSGKTTLINLITGVLEADSGDIRFDGMSIRGLPRSKIAGLGITRTFQNLRLFNTLSVLDHVMAGRFVRSQASFVSSVCLTSFARAENRENVDKCMELLEMVGLAGKEHLPARSLPYGQRRQLEIARALATEPRLLFLDEPAAGMSSGEIRELIKLIFKIRAQGITVVFIEHRMPVVMTAADDIVVLNYGQSIAQGSSEAIQSDPEVIKAYLGTAYKRELDPVAERG